MVEAADARLLLDDEHLRIEAFEPQRVLIVRRKPAAADGASAFATGLALIRPEHRAWGVVIDLREVAGRNDAAFEDSIRPLQRHVEAHFARVVFLLRSAVGELQVARLKRETGSKLLYTRDEDEAFRMAQD
jgi:hypothetical protein